MTTNPINAVKITIYNTQHTKNTKMYFQKFKLSKIPQFQEMILLYIIIHLFVIRYCIILYYTILYYMIYYVILYYIPFEELSEKPSETLPAHVQRHICEDHARGRSRAERRRLSTPLAYNTTAAHVTI